MGEESSTFEPSFCSECGTTQTAPASFCFSCGYAIRPLGDSEACRHPHCDRKAVTTNGACLAHEEWVRKDAEIIASLRKAAQERPQQRPSGPSAVLICPHCGTQGRVTVKRIVAKDGISPGKLGAAYLTSGVSILVTGLAKKGLRKELRCQNCKMKWLV